MISTLPWIALLLPLLSLACLSCTKEEVPEAVNGIKICGQVFRVDAPCLRWDQDGGYDAYHEGLAFPEETVAATDLPSGKRFGRRSVSEGREHTLDELKQHVTQLVLHYDVSGYSRQCFKVLHDRRGLSTHFLLDLDGQIYQTLDLQERAWHAGVANNRSIGIEIANVGAYGAGAYGAGEDGKRLRTWYLSDDQGVRIVLPIAKGKTGLPPGFVGRPARGVLQKGVVHGRLLSQWDFTQAQYRSLASLLRVLRSVFPRLRLDYPRDAFGKLLRRVLTAGELQEFEGVLGHWHVSARKVDPGPAFDWERLMREGK